MGQPTLVQSAYNIADDDNSDPDLCTFDGVSTERSDQAKLETFMVRCQVRETAGTSASSKNWQLYYNTSDSTTGASQVVTAASGGTVCIIGAGTPTDGATCDEIKCGTQSETWSDGLYSEADETGKYLLAGSNYTEFQFCVEFDADSSASQTYYFFVHYNNNALNTYTTSAKVTVAAGNITVTPNFISSGWSVPAPTTSTGPVTTVPTFIVSGSAVPAPTITTTVTSVPTFIPSASVVPEPTTSTGPVTSVPNFIPSGSVVPAPTTSTGPVTTVPLFIPSGSTVPAPTTSTPITSVPDFIPSGSTVPNPTTSTGPVTSVPDVIPSGSVVYEPTVSLGGGAQTTIPNFIPSGSAVPAPTTSTGPVTSVPTFIASGSAVLTPTTSTGPVTTVPNFIGSGSTVPEPTTSTGPVTTVPTFIVSGSTVPTPTLSTTVTTVPTFIASGSSVPAPTTSTGPVTSVPTFIPSGNVVYEPTAGVGGGSQTVIPNFIGSGNAVPTPTTSVGPVTVTPTFITSGSVAYAPGYAGLAPTVTTHSIGATARDYATFTAWDLATEGDLVSDNEAYIGQMYADADFTAQLNINGSTTDAVRYRRVEAAPGEQYDPDGDTGVKITGVTGQVCYLNEGNCQVSGLGVFIPGSPTGTQAFRFAAAGCLLERSFATTASGGFHYLIFHNVNSGGTNTIRNVIVENNSDGGDTTYSIFGQGSTHLDVYNFSAYTATNNGTSYGIKNNIGGGSVFDNLQNVVSNGHDAGEDFDAGTQNGGTTWSHNTSEDSTAPGTDAQTSKSGATVWVDPANGDFTPQNDILDAGADLSALFTDDYYGNTRPSPWDRGAVEALDQVVTPLFIASGSQVFEPVVGVDLVTETRALTLAAVVTLEASVFRVVITPRFIDMQTSAVWAATPAVVTTTDLAMTATATMVTEQETSGLAMTATATMRVDNVEIEWDATATMTAAGSANGLSVLPMTASANLAAVPAKIQTVTVDWFTSANMVAYAIIFTPSIVLTASATMVTDVIENPNRSASWRVKAQMRATPDGTLPPGALVDGITVLDFERGLHRGAVRGGSRGAG